MDKHILNQYTDLLEEADDLENRIAKIERSLYRLRKQEVSDSVTHGKKGKKPLKRTVITGMPEAAIRGREEQLKTYRQRLEESRRKAMNLINQVESYVASIKDSRVRRIFRLRYVDRLTWYQVAQRMGEPHTADGCRMAVDRFLGETEKKC